MQTSGSLGQEHRRDKRYSYYGNVGLIRSMTGAALPGHIVNVSSGGWLMKLVLPGEDKRMPLFGKGKTLTSLVRCMMRDFGKGAVVDARFNSSYLSFLARARVCRSDDENGMMALEFLDVSQRGRDELLKLTIDLEDRLARRPDRGMQRLYVGFDS